MANKKENKEESGNKEYIVTYESEEHYEVLGWVEASSLEKAKQQAKKLLIGEANKYGVKEAEIAEWKNGDKIKFDL